MRTSRRADLPPESEPPRKFRSRIPPRFGIRISSVRAGEEIQWRRHLRGSPGRRSQPPGAARARGGRGRPRGTRRVPARARWRSCGRTRTPKTVHQKRSQKRLARSPTAPPRRCATTRAVPRRVIRSHGLVPGRRATTRASTTSRCTPRRASGGIDATAPRPAARRVWELSSRYVARGILTMAPIDS